MRWIGFKEWTCISEKKCLRGARKGLVEASLNSVSRMSQIQGILTPNDFYQVIDRPAPLAGMISPTNVKTPWEAFSQAGYRSVMCLSTYNPQYDPAPLTRLKSIRLDDLALGTPPSQPNNEKLLIKRAAEKIIEEMERGAGVIVHSAGGTGRTGMVLGMTLCSLGYGVEQVIRYLNYLAIVRGRMSGWPQTPWQEDFLREAF